MKIQDYKNAMNEWSIDKTKLFVRVKEQADSAAPRQPVISPRPALAAVLALCLVMGLLLSPVRSDPKTGFTIRACASGKELLLLEEKPVFLDCHSDIQFAVTHAESGWGVANYNIWFSCEGDGIQEITYRCQEAPVTMDNLKDASCYFVRNLTVPVEEKAQYRDQENFLRSLQPSDSDECELVLLLGSEYTVPYDRQETSDIGIELPVTAVAQADDTAAVTYETASVDPITIDVILTMEDGSTQIRSLLLSPVEEDALSGLKLQLLP